jgi:hypothetical protein
MVTREVIFGVEILKRRNLKETPVDRKIFVRPLLRELGAVASGGINLAYRSQPANCESHISISYYYIMQALVTFLTWLQLTFPIHCLTEL